EVRMADIRRVAPPLAQPRLLKRELAEGMVDGAADLVHSPRHPRPELRQAVIEDGNAVCLGPRRDMPVEAGIVDEDNTVRPLLTKVAVGLSLESEKLGELRQHRTKSHHCQFAHVLQQLATGCVHAWPAKSRAVQPRLAAGQFGNQVCPVQVAAWFADGEEEFHAEIISNLAHST